jgi:membrane fusion protein, heavy metal efflux system
MKIAHLRRAALALLIVTSFTLGACGDRAAQEPAEGTHAAADAFERGPHNGRLLRDGPFALEVTVYEAGVPPEFRLYGYRDGKPLQPGALQPVVEVRRLDDETTRFTFRPEGDALVADGTVVEPHSFDVKVSVVNDGRTHTWTYASYEGRVTIPAATAAASGVKTSTAGPASIRDVLPLMGNVAIDRSRQAQVRARFPGIVRAVPVNLGDHVRRGQTLATTACAATPSPRRWTAWCWRATRMSAMSLARRRCSRLRICLRSGSNSMRSAATPTACGRGKR